MDEVISKERQMTLSSRVDELMTSVERVSSRFLGFTRHFT